MYKLFSPKFYSDKLKLKQCTVLNNNSIIMVMIIIIIHNIDLCIMKNGNISNISPKVILCKTHIGCRHK